MLEEFLSHLTVKKELRMWLQEPFVRDSALLLLIVSLMGWWLEPTPYPFIPGLVAVLIFLGHWLNPSEPPYVRYIPSIVHSWRYRIGMIVGGGLIMGTIMVGITSLMRDFAPESTMVTYLIGLPIGGCLLGARYSFRR